MLLLQLQPRRLNTLRVCDARQLKTAFTLPTDVVTGSITTALLSIGSSLGYNLVNFGKHVTTYLQTDAVRSCVANPLLRDVSPSSWLQDRSRCLYFGNMPGEVVHRRIRKLGESLEEWGEKRTSECQAQIVPNAACVSGPQHRQRIDLAGGWSDTPPICYEHGGAVATCLQGKTMFPCWQYAAASCSLR